MSANASGELRGFRILLSRRLLAWSLASLAAVALLLFLASGFWQAFGIQALAWGGVDALIALAGLAGARRRAERAGRSASQQSDGLRKLLWINTLRDLLYVAAGIGLALLAGGHGPAWRGHGWGVALQGAFLLFFDLIHAQSVPAPIQEPLQAFSGPEHLPFRLDGAPGGPGALLVHGFPGTPAEMRHLAETLHRVGGACSPRTFQPLAKADFADPRLLELLRQFLPGMDLEDEAVQQQLRGARMPVTIIREILACGRSAFRQGSC